MAVLISDDGQIKTYQREDGSTYGVPSAHIPTGIGPDPGTSIADVRPETPSPVDIPQEPIAPQITPEPVSEPVTPVVEAPVAPIPKPLEAVSEPVEPTVTPGAEVEVEEPPRDFAPPTTIEGVNVKMAESNRLRAEAAKDLAGVESEEAVATSALREEEQKFLGDYEVKTEEREARKQAQVAEQEGKISELQAQYENTEIDSEKWWGDKETSGKAAAIFGVFLANLGGTMVGGKGGQGIDMMNRLVDRNIDAQKANLAKKGRSLEHARGMLGDLYTKFGDETATAIAAKQVTAEKFASKFAQVADTSRSEKVVVAAKDAEAQFLAEAANQGLQLTQYQDSRSDRAQDIALREKAQKAAAGARWRANKLAQQREARRQMEADREFGFRESQLAEQRAGRVAAGEAAEYKRTARFQDDPKAIEYLDRGDDPKQLVTGRDGKVIGSARTAESAGAAQAALAAHDNFQEKLSAFRKRAKTSDWNKLSKDARDAEFEILRGQLVGPLAKQLAGGFNPSQAMEERAMKMLQRKDVMGLKNVTAGIDILSGISSSETNRALTDAGVITVDRGKPSHDVSSYYEEVERKAGITDKELGKTTSTDIDKVKKGWNSLVEMSNKGNEEMRGEARNSIRLALSDPKQGKRIARAIAEDEILRQGTVGGEKAFDISKNYPKLLAREKELEWLYKPNAKGYDERLDEFLQRRAMPTRGQ